VAGAGAVLLAVLVALSGPLAGRADAATITGASGVTPANYSIQGGASGAAVAECQNPAWSIIPGTSWIGVTPTGCAGSNAASNHTTDYTVTFTLPANFTTAMISGQFLHDNHGKVILNGNVLVNTGVDNYAGPPDAFSSSNQAFFQAGVNTIDFQVTDLGGPNGADFTFAASFSSADLSLTKTAAPVTPPGCSAAQATQAGATQPCVLHGQNVQYTLTDTNNGPDPATTPTITDTLPTGQSFVSSDAGCTAVGQVVTCPTSTLPNGSFVTIHIIASTSGVPSPLNAPVTQTDTATVSSTTGDPNPANNTATATITVIPAADLSLTKTSSPNPVVAGQQVIYTLTVTNNGPDTAVNTKIVDTLPPGFTLATEGVVELVRNTIGGGVEVVGNAPTAAALAAAAGQASCTGVTSAGVTTVTCLPGNLAAGQTKTVTIVGVAPTTPGTATNVATVSSDTADPNIANNTATNLTTVTAACTDTRTNTTISSSVTAEPGTFLCLTNVTVNGGVQIDAGAGLIMTNSTATSLQGEAPAFITVCGSTINGSVVVHDATGLVRIGDKKTNCAPNRITGSVTLDYNHGGAAGPGIAGNRISGSLICKQNVPVATDEGLTNPTNGAKLHECAGAAF